MTDWSSFKHGAVTYPLTASTANPLLQDADPSLYQASAFLVAMVEYFVAARFKAQAALVGLAPPTAIRRVINEDPSPFLTADQSQYPLFALYRDSETQNEHTVEWEKSIAQWKFAYVLGALNPRQQDQLNPILHSVARVIGRAVSKGWHPSYQGGAPIWTQAGIQRAWLGTVNYSGFERVDTLNDYYRAVTGSITVWERDFPVPGDFQAFGGADIAIDQQSGDGTVLSDVVDASTIVAPTITNLSSTSGTKAGGLALTITGTGYRRPSGTIGGAKATVTASTTTTVSVTTPAHAAYPTFMADVVVTNDDGQSATLSAGYSFTTP